MQLTLLSPRKSLNKAFLKVKPSRSEIELFKKNLIGLLDGLDKTESEEHNKNDLGDFLKNTFYHPKFYINTKDRTDLVIHNSPDSKTFPAVLIEAKKPSNKGEMIRPDNLNAKAFQELMLYYLRERITNHNLEIRHLVATNVYEWYVFDANFFEKTFAQNKILVKQFTDFEEGRLAGTTTDFFYRELAEPFLAALTSEICFTWFDFRDYDKPLRNEDKKDDSKLIALYKLLSPEHLLKLPFVNDSNSLDKAFYTELLHIIGLTETKEGGKKLIGRKKEGQRDPGSLIENTMIQIDSLDMISRLNKPNRFGENPQERLFNVSLELVITWINRILFLKLLEAQLVKYNKGNSSFSFLTSEKVQGYDALNSLFFRVLARKPSERDPAVAMLFEKVPYLNSSLFEPTELERETIFISNLQDDCLIPIHSGTVLKNNTGKRLAGLLTGLDYFFAFLDSYDFSGEGAEEIQEENKSLINASVLGLIFEKINGYKDGSFFTPGFITMYMCRETIRRAVVQKFNDLKGWNCQNLAGLYDQIDDKKEANEIINQLKICDPAVGSGHFLVSALNEIIAIKSELKILSDKEDKRLKEYHVEVANDELIVTDEDGELFEYNPRSPESQRVQEALFREKQTIIENCLFGVDINPNSVKICRLRLWIELLKNSYYKAESNYTELETLPNIDINIKCGNSLISRYALDADIKQALKKSKWNIHSYRLAVMTYRNARGKEEKREMERLIESIKSDFETEVAANDKRLTQLKKLNGDLFTHTNQTSLFERSKKELAEWNKKVNELTGKIKKLETELEEIKNNKIYENAFEWRFEFPEVINDEGDFVGFDVVIGNPPYQLIESKSSEGIYLNEEYKYSEGKPDLFKFFLERGHQILCKNGSFSFIVPASLLTIPSCKNIRSYLLNQNELYEVINFWGSVFEEAEVNSIIISTCKSNESRNVCVIEDDSEKPTSDTLENSIEHKVFLNSKYWKENENYLFNTTSSSLEFDLLKKIKKSSIPLGNICRYTLGLQVYHNSIHSKEEIEKRVYHSTDKLNDTYFPEIHGSQVMRFHFLENFQEYVAYGNWCYNKPEWVFCAGKRVLIREILGSDGLVCALIELTGIPNKAIIIAIPEKFSNEYLLGLLSSRLFTFYVNKTTEKGKQRLFPRISLSTLKNLPIKLPNKDFESKIHDCVTQIIESKKLNPNVDICSLEKEIDQLVYTLYGLTEEEIKIIEQSF